MTAPVRYEVPTVVADDFLKWPAKTLMPAILAAMAVRVIALRSGVDRLTTIGTWSKPWCAFVALVLGVTIGMVVARLWFAPSADEKVTARYVNLKADSFSLWCLCGVVIAIGFGAATAWICVGLMSVGAQYLGGSSTSFDATVISDGFLHTSRGVCNRELEVRRDSEGSDLRICLSTRHRPSLATGTLELGMLVRVRVVDTQLGMVVQSVEPRP